MKDIKFPSWLSRDIMLFCSGVSFGIGLLAFRIGLMSLVGFAGFFFVFCLIYSVTTKR